MKRSYASFQLKHFALALGALTAWAEALAHADGPATPVDAGLRTSAAAPPDPGSDDDLPQLYRDMGVVQRRAMRKAGRFLLSTYFSLDFSDGPYTLYSVNLNPGYAISDFLEVYAGFAPVFISNPRSIVTKVQELTLANGQQATIVSAKPKMQFGVEVLWAPLYGKDSLGISRLVRSDTFVKLAAGQIQYEGGSGLRFALGLGKTYFLSKNLGFRVAADFGYLQTIVDGVEGFRGMAIIESGLMVYF